MVKYLGSSFWLFVGCIAGVLDCRLLLVHIVGVVWDILKRARCVFVDVLGLVLEG